MSFTMRARRTRRVVAILAVGLLAAVVPGTALAAGSGATVVRGIQHEYGSCGERLDGYLMDGSLDGLLVGRHVRGQADARAGNDARPRHGAFHGVARGVYGTF